MNKTFRTLFTHAAAALWLAPAAAPGASPAQKRQREAVEPVYSVTGEKLGRGELPCPIMVPAGS